MVKTKWDMIRERKLKEKHDKVEAAWTQVDQSWMRYTYCRICGKKFVVNNYEDRQVRLPKLGGVIICPWCYGHGGEFIVRLYKLVKRIAESEGQGLDVDLIDQAAKIMAKASPEGRRNAARQPAPNSTRKYEEIEGGD